MSVEPLLYTPQQAAEALQIGLSKTWELIGSGQLPSIKVGRLRRVPVDALKQFIAQVGQ